VKPLAYDLFCGKGGWSHGLMSAGWDCIGYDIADMGGYPGELRLADVLTLNGADMADADLIVASPPCQFFSYTAMPWTRAKKLAAEVRADPARLAQELALFRACFRLQQEAIAASGGRHLPLVVENVVGAQAWVGRAKWHYGSFYLWGDVPALMPRAVAKATKTTAHVNRRDGHGHTRHLTNQAESDRARGVKQPGLAGKRRNGLGANWFAGGAALLSSGSTGRKEASAKIAMIPYEMARWIGECYYPRNAISVRMARALAMEVLR